MAEKLYTIPVNEAFEARKGCPFCALFKRLEQNEIDLILGASMMEPDVRKQTNAKGFCKEHFRMLYAAQKRLPLALVLESHLQEAENALKPGLLGAQKGDAIAQKAKSLAESCYICDRIEFHFSKMFETAALLYDSDPAFREKLAAQPYFCLEHYARFLLSARLKQPKKRFGDFTLAMRGVEEAYLAKTREEISAFCKKFDYRYVDEPWGEEKNAVEHALNLFGIDAGEKR